ncbi:two pore potassium channel protein sup-9-like isoform X2 [Oculina patagonica]
MATKVLLKRSLWRTFLFAAYSMFGSWLFYYIERTPITYKEMSANMLDELKQKYNMSMNHSDFTAFANDAYKAVKVGRKVEWTFLNTTSYVFTILTTIGYGHMTPDTWVGQLVTVFYGLVGLPISMLALKTLGEVIVSGIQSLVLRIEKRLLKTRQVRKIRQKTFVGTCVLMILFLLLGSVINVLAEGWSFVEGIYVWFVVLSTIGFGDYIPFQSLDQKSESGREILWVLIAILAFFVLLGLCVVSAVLTSLVQAAEEFKSKTKPAGKLVQFVKRQKTKMLRSSVYETKEEMVDEEERRCNAVVLLEINSRVRSNSI